MKLIPSDSQNSDHVIMDLLRYWESLRAGRIAPLRSEIDPRQIKSALGVTFILDVDPIGGIRFRLAGPKICDLMGMELRGMPARSLIVPYHREDFELSLHNMTERPEILDLRLAAQGSGNTPAARMLLLPMLGGDTSVDRILGCFALHSPVFDPPLRFTIREKYRTRIVTATADADHENAGGFAEQAGSFTPADDAGGGRQLRIVSDNYGKTRT